MKQPRQQKRLRGLRSYLTTIRLTLEAFFKVKLGWLVPLVILLLILALILALVGSMGPLAPFVYPLL